MLNLLYIVRTTPPKGTYIMKKLILTSAIALLVASPLAMAKDPTIASNSSSVKDAGFINSMASAVLVVAGSNGTTCRVPVSDGNSPKMMGINCK